jgi:outer membrane protein assembly factor BamB
MSREVIYIGIGGHAVAIDASTGTEIWRTRLKGRDIVTVYTAGDRLLAGAGGELFGLDPVGGSILWHNTLKGLGLGLIAFDSGASIAAARHVVQRRRTAAAAGAASAS